MSPFSKTELKVLFFIFLFIFSYVGFNLNISLRRARDAQRKADIGSLVDAVGRFGVDFGYFPPSTSDGKILNCKADNFEAVKNEIEKKDTLDLSTLITGLRGCNWGADSLEDLLDPNYPAYLKTIPSDPKQSKGVTFVYFSNTKRFQFYGYLEGGSSEDEYREGIVKRKIACGDKICNFGKAFSDTPLDKSIEEYENELLEKAKLQKPQLP